MSLPRLVAALSCLLVLAGCGTSGPPETDPRLTPASPDDTSFTTAEPTPTVTPTPTPTVKPTPTPTATPTPTPTAAPPPAKDVPPRGAIDLSGMTLPQFDNESTTVTCLFDGHEGASVRCDVMPPSGWSARKPADCQDAYGDAVMLAARARLICHGDTIWSPDTSKVIRKGQTYRFGDDVWCTAGSASEVTCRNPEGRGFTVTQGTYRIF